MANSKLAIGIDLGTTNSCVAVFRYGKTEIIANDLGYPTTPSIVAFTKKEKFVGNAAKDQKLENQENTVYDVKRIIGRQFTDPTVKTDVKILPFKVTNSEGKPLIWVTYKNEEYKFFPEEISAAVLTKMKKIAEDYVGTSITDAVITVPAYFNNSQRQATKDAGQIAGLNVIRMINEPTAAAIAYGMDKMSEGEKNILIFDLGGGTFDVSILTIESGNFEVKATAGDTHLGGIDFDRRMVEFVTDEIRVLHKRDLSQNKKAIGRLLDACEKAKCELSEKTEAFISVPSLFGESEDFNFKITRAKFEQICMDMFESTTDPVKKALGFAKMHKVDIDEVILVGGSTHIPMIQKLLSDFFDGKELNKSISPDEAVAYGAAMQAASLNGHLEVQDLLLLDVIPLSLGMREEGGIMSIFFERNSIVPMKRTQIYSTSKDDQTSVDVLIYEGESDLVDKNHLLGHFKLTDIPKAARRIPKIEVTFEIDTSGLLTVTAIDTSTKNQNKITIKKDQRHLTTEQINEALKRAENFLDDDQKNYEQILEKNKLRELAYQYITSVNEASFISRMSEAERKQVSEKAEKVLKWIKENDDATKDEIQRERKSLESTAIPVIEKFKEISRSNSNNRKPKPGSSGGPSAGSSAGPSTGFSSGHAANRPSTSNNTQNPGKPRTGPIIREKN